MPRSALNNTKASGDAGSDETKPNKYSLPTYILVIFDVCAERLFEQACRKY
jgi:hypothetical protein